MSGSSPKPRRLRAGLRRHGMVPRPAELRRLLRVADLQFTAGNAIELYPDGASGIEAMLEAIAAARKRIHLETYILRADETGRRFLRALSERARAGVEVRVLCDGFGSRGLDPGALADLRDAGGDVVAFHPLRRFHPRWAPWQRDHRKILVVDGAIAFTGGLNIGDEYFFGVPGLAAQRITWRDAHVRIAGGAVPMLEAVFLESWFRADGPGRPWLDFAPPPAPTLGGESVAVLADGPTYHTRRMRDLLLAALARSQERVQLVTPYFLPGRRLREALGAASDRGVRVELLIAGTSDHPVLRWAAHSLLPELVGRGLRVYEFERAMMHAKVAIFDDTWAILGTSNLDRQSLRRSYEVNLIVAGGALPGSLSQLMESDLLDSRRLTARDLQARSWPRRLRDRAASFVLTRL